MLARVRGGRERAGCEPTRWLRCSRHSVRWAMRPGFWRSSTYRADMRYMSTSICWYTSSPSAAAHHHTRVRWYFFWYEDGAHASLKTKTPKQPSWTAETWVVPRLACGRWQSATLAQQMRCADTCTSSYNQSATGACGNILSQQSNPVQAIASSLLTAAFGHTSSGAAAYLPHACG